MIRLIKRRYFQRIFICYALVFVGLLMSLAGVSVASGYQGEVQRQTAKLEEESSKLAQWVDSRFYILSNTCIQLLDNTWIHKVRSQSEIIVSSIDLLHRREICESINDYTGMSGIVDTLALFLPQKRQAIARDAFWDSEERYLRSVDINATEFLDDFYGKVCNSFASLVLVPVPTEKGDFAVGQRLDAYAEPEIIVFFHVDGYRFQRMLKDLMQSDAFAFEISVGDESMYRYQVEGVGEDLCFERYSELFGWNYRIWLPAPRIALFTLFTAFCTFFALPLLGLCLALLFSMFTYRPVLEILRRLKLLPRSNDEFMAIRDGFEDIQQSQINLEGLNSQYYHTARNNLLLSLLHGPFTRTITDQTLSLFGIPFDCSGKWLHMVVVIRREEDREERIAEGNIRLQNFLVLNHISAIKCVTSEAEMILIFSQKVLTEEARKACAQTLAKQVMQLRAFCGDSLRNCTCVSGLQHYGLMGISKSYQEALEQRADIETGYANGHYFPLDWEIQLIEQLRACNLKVVQRILQELERENLKRVLSAAQHRQVIALIREILTRVARELNVEHDEFSDRLDKAVAVSEQETAWRCLNEMADRLCQSSTETYGGELGVKILDYVQGHYRDVNLSQKWIADDLGISCPSLSRIFKKTTGKNFVDYLLELRTETAKQAFDAGATNIAEVVRSCGYENEVTFRRAFFRAYAITPYQYVQHLNGNAE